MTTSAQTIQEHHDPKSAYHKQFVSWFHEVAPYIHAFRGRTVVVAFGGELVEAGMLNLLVQDLSLLDALGMRLVVVHGSRPQVNAQLALKGIEGRFDRGMRITDAAALECAKEASGEIRLDIEAAFSQGLPNTPMAHSAVRVVSGNFITARPIGVIDGVDYQFTGSVRKVDGEALKRLLKGDAVVLISPLGFSPTGEAFNLPMEEVATAVAVALDADKLIFVTESQGISDEQGQLLTEISEQDTSDILRKKYLSEDLEYYLKHALKAVQSGVERAHIVPYAIDGSVLIEMFTHDGVGTMLSEDTLDDLREAEPDDVGAILQLIEPLENDGTLVKRGRDRIEREVEYFSVLEHDGMIYGCAALYPFPVDRMAEMACLTVNQSWQGSGEGEKLLKHIEQRARAKGFEKLFVLTTRTAHWFMKRGFVVASVDDLPKDRQTLYNWSRKSQVLIKRLS